MNKTILVADEDKTFCRIIRRVFEGTDWRVKTAKDGVAALESISAKPPDVLLLNLDMPRLGGQELLARMRGNPRLAMIPVIVISGANSPREKAVELGFGADDFISKPFDTRDLISRVEGAVRRSWRMLSVSPLTSLPGGPAIEEEVWRRIKANVPLAYFYINIDNFTAYSHNYGCLNGNNAIKCAGGLLADTQNYFAAEDMFVGHIGGDNFAVMVNPRKAEELARAIAVGFDAMAPGFYSETDQARGFIISKDCFGAAREFPLMTLSIAIATNEKRALDRYADIVEAVGEIKIYLKNFKNRFGSIYMKDWRGA